MILRVERNILTRIFLFKLRPKVSRLNIKLCMYIVHANYTIADLVSIVDVVRRYALVGESICSPRFTQPNKLKLGPH